VNGLASIRVASPADFRSQFPVLASMVHLASCGLGARSTALDAALARMLDEMTRPGTPWHQFEEEAERARRRFAALIGAQADQIALIPNASIGAYQAVSTLDLSRRSRVLTTTAEFPSVAHVWLAQRERGAEVSFVDGDRQADGVEDHHVLAAHYRAAIDERVALVSIPMVTYQHGVHLPVAAVARAAHAVGSKVFVDAYQAVGVRPVDVTELNCDYLVAGAAKYLLGLPGVAFLYARSAPPGDHDPVLTGWFGRINPFAFDPGRLDFPSTARRFETGTPAVPALYAANAGMELIAGLDLEAVRAHVDALVDLCTRRLEPWGDRVRVVADPAARGAHLGLVARDPPALAAWLATRGISVSPRGNVIRISFHYYNHARDVATLCDALDEFQTAHQ
jgi:selenocysteine lyase/cysteine desulfurase